ncbi:MAG TPA: hypothetical protein VGS27_23950 [Candidatus Sulfotelmatobacter sp.]|nr:hypothetical protein [Candidatus Sulfotelmatobacter sp.]
MPRLMVRTACAITLLFAASFAFAQTEFSADVYNNQRPDGPQAKIYMGKDKARFESGKKEARGGGAVIIDLQKQTSTVLMDERQMYMEVPQQMAKQRAAYNFFHARDVENACSEWLARPENQGGSCHKVGNETVNGRNTVKYEGTNSKGETGTVWLDPKLQFPVKWQGKNGDTGELRNIQEGTQPASLFEIPAGYKKFEMPNMGNMGGMPNR